MVVVPAVTPVTTPEPETTVATEVLLLVHVPDGVASLSVVVNPEHTAKVPVIFAGNGLTVITLVLIQPVGNVYVIVDVPATRPLTRPVPELTVAAVVLLLLHVPKGVASLNDVVRPAHTVADPVIATGNGLTVTGVVRIHPVPNV